MIGIQSAIGQSIPQSLFEAQSDNEAEAADAFEKYQAEQKLAEMLAEQMKNGAG